LVLTSQTKAASNWSNWFVITKPSAEKKPGRGQDCVSASNWSNWFVITKPSAEKKPGRGQDCVVAASLAGAQLGPHEPNKGGVREALLGGLPARRAIGRHHEADGREKAREKTGLRRCSFGCRCRVEDRAGGKSRDMNKTGFRGTTWSSRAKQRRCTGGAPWRPPSSSGDRPSSRSRRPRKSPGEDRTASLQLRLQVSCRGSGRGKITGHEHPRAIRGTQRVRAERARWATARGARDQRWIRTRYLKYLGTKCSG
jgi:hypothetical protein